MKNCTIQRISALTLVVLLVLSVLCGCSNPNEGTDQTTADENPAESSTAEDPAESGGEVTTEFNYPVQTFDFTEEAVNILSWSDTEHQEFTADGQIGEPVNDAIYLRNFSVEERLGVTLNFISTPGNTSNIQNYIDVYANSFNAGEKAYDVLASYSRTMSTAAQKGYCQDMTKIEYIDLERPWWPESLYREANIGGALYFASGDISANMLYMMYALIVNLNIATECGLPDLYAIVNNGEWTVDKLREVVTNTYTDLNSNSAKDNDDRHGFVVSTIHVDPFYFGSGLKFIEHNTNGEIALSSDFTSEKAVDVINKYNTLLWGTNDGYYNDAGAGGREIFADGRALFVCDRGPQVAAKLLTEVDFKYAMLPTPKYDTAQENYYTTLAFPFTFYAVPVDAHNTELSGAFIEMFAMEGYRKVTPALFEQTIKLKYAETDEASKMYDVIRESVGFDLGRVYATSFNGMSYSVLRTCISGNTNTWASQTKSASKTVPKLIKNLLDAFE